MNNKRKNEMLLIFFNGKQISTDSSITQVNLKKPNTI